MQTRLERQEAIMADLTGSEPPITLADRVRKYRVSIEAVVKLGVEHQQYEFKRIATLKKDALADRLDFVKLVQGMANAHSDQERFIVIGADQAGKRFESITNQNEFDPANVQQILSKYLDPVPEIEVFNSLQTDAGESYVLIVISPDQPRPVICATEGVSGSKTHFVVGDIWIKQGTSLARPVKSDLDRMYDKRIDEEAESRAHRRFQHYQEEFGKTGPLVTLSPTPTRTLLVGPKEHLSLFIEDVIATSAPPRLKVLLEMARDRLVDSWEPLQFRGHGLPRSWEEWLAEVQTVYKDDFTPALDSVVALGLEVVRYEAPPEWLSWILALLVEAFDRSRTFDRLKSSTFLERPDGLLFAQPAYDVYVGVRAIATYCMMRGRFSHLAVVLRTFVRYFTFDNNADTSTPLVFWPFSGISGFPDMRNGRNEALWKARLQSAWGSYFGSEEKFMQAALQLEFVLELNSYLFENLGDPSVQDLKKKMGNRVFGYLPDFWNASLDEAAPIAALLLEHLKTHNDIPTGLAIVPEAFVHVLKGKNRRDRKLFLGKFLGHLRSWQNQASIQYNRFPRLFYWPGELGEAEKEATATGKGQPAT
jgi:hypothetical protein